MNNIIFNWSITSLIYNKDKKSLTIAWECKASQEIKNFISSGKYDKEIDEFPVKDAHTDRIKQMALYYLWEEGVDKNTIEQALKEKF